MGLSLTSPVWLIALAAVPGVWIATGLGRTGFGRSQRRVQALVRSALIAALALALARPVIGVASSRTSVVYLVDVSHSISSRAITLAADAIDGFNAAARPTDKRILAFGRTAGPVADAAALRQMANPDAGGAPDPLGRDGTNLEQALSAARAALPPGTNGRIVLFSDGRETEGSGLAAADRLAAAHVPVFTRAEDPRDLGDTWIAGIVAPETSPARGVTGLDIDVGSQRTGDAVVTIRDGDRLLATTPAALRPGRTTIPIDVSLDGPGPHLIEARVAAPGDVLPSNNVLTREVRVTPALRVLYVQQTGASGLLARALEQAGLDVTTIGTDALPATSAAFDAWDVVVLSNLARSSLRSETMTALDAWVETHGGGVLFAGGGAVFGEGARGAATGFHGTAIERVLPVTFEREDTPEVALVIVLDRSWSMQGAALELCKAAADAAVNTLSDAQIIGVVTFNNEYEWNVPLGSVRDNRPAIHAAIEKITASGPTMIYPALEQAYLSLSAVRARAKHVVLLSDGQTSPDDYEGLARKMAGAGITVSAVSLGPEADVKLLTSIAGWGKGRSYVVGDAEQLPQIFVKEAQDAATPGFEAGGVITARVHQPGFFEGAAAEPLPPLHGRNAVTRKPGAIDVVSTADGEPLLTVWPAGLGRTAMFAADVDGGWSADWVGWKGFGAFFATAARAIARDPRPAQTLTITPAPPDGATRAVGVVLEARVGSGRFHDLLSPLIDARDGGESRRVAMTQTAPGRYAATVTADAARPLAISVAGAPPGASRIAVADPAAEYRFDPPDLARLASIARTTGGTAEARPDDVRQAPQASGMVHYAVAPALLVAALLLWLADILVRRVRF
jgi:uncharacterized membrane protein/uncharacterized protein YegL